MKVPRRRSVLPEAKVALAALLVFGSTSAVWAASKRPHQGGPAARSRTSPTIVEQRSTTTKPAVKPFTAEEKAWFDRASRVF
jgi:hypothetical protein